ncbi:MAG: FKBP-type peptidyl-prolyl cis-trans isomerase [Prevotella sp.]|nr:FKBP-type peptidyl-prolyl cis-trans isomerase [Bacteroidales bacterium]MDD6745389.1 FKBP-type peptidyl-prolyl cis-trans isomerase [Bacteroidales bacterium]MDY3842726.1 FKBP-type peptidyl-prolyl cis-trans isomerase [Prevotella sp.]
MKKIILLALVFSASASFNIVSADKKKKKSAEAVEVAAQPVVLATASDSVSFAAGKAATLGLIQYLQQEYQVDTAYMHDVVKGFNEAMARFSDPEYKAYNAGAQVARMVLERILPGTASKFEGTSDSISADLFTAGFRAALVGDSTLFTDDKAREYFEDRLVASREEAQRVYREANEQWLAQNRDKEGVKTTASGLQYKILRAGTGAVPTDKDRVTVKYEGKMIDGTVFDSSYKRTPQTSTFGCTQVIKGWTEALTMMPVGSKWELYIPQELGYGSRQAGQIKPYSTLIFTVELEGIEQAAPKN